MMMSAWIDGSDANNLKILHLSFHKGCIHEIDAVAEELGLNVETWFIPSLPKKSFDGNSIGNQLYNIGHERAQNIWDLHQDYFETFDVILTSDTAALSRIFLQNNWQKPLVIWICNRFDYCDRASLDCNFPDDEYYRLFDEASKNENVTVIAYNGFEHFYAKSKGINTGDLIITPCCPKIPVSFDSKIPQSVRKEETFFLPPYHNETLFMDFSRFCANLGIPNYCGRYQGPMDLKDFKGIIHLPYGWSNLAFFENIRLGLPYFIPSIDFMRELAGRGNYFFQDSHFFFDKKMFYLSEWYAPKNRDCIVYFDSWDDLLQKIEKTDYPVLRKKILRYAQKNKETMLNRWKQVFDRFKKNK